MTNIGVFDSGLGGIAVLNELSKKNKAHYFYLGDNLRVPYGNRSKEEIKSFAYDIVSFLEQFDIDYYIIACNTISTTALDFLKTKFNKKFIPITDIAVRAATSYKGDYLTLATKATVESHYYKQEIEKITGARVYEQAASKLVDYIESGILTGKELSDTLKEYLLLANEKKIENIVLACTHYPLIKEEIKKVISYEANIIDPAKFLASYIESDSKNLDINIYMTKYSKDTENLIKQIMECNYSIDFIGEL